MKSLATLALILIAAALPLRPAVAQQRPVLSPRDSVALTLDTNSIAVNYGRPSMRGRVIMGGLVPWDKVWRTGANQATHLVTNFDMVMGGVPVPKGRYTLWTLPSASGWKMIINKQTGQWGTAYDPGQDLARFDAKTETLPSPVDTFTIALRQSGPVSGVLALSWEKTRVSTPFEKNDSIRPLSPPDSAAVQLAGKSVRIAYSRPFMRGRQIWGVVVPMDSIWRTGANAATTLVSETAVLVGTSRVPEGTYVLRSIPSPQALTLLISKNASTPRYDKSQDVARVTMPMTKAPSTIDPLRIWFEPAGERTASLKIGWADRVFSAPVSLP